MDIKETATYPYPIWGLNNSFKGDGPISGQRRTTSNNETNSLDIAYKILASNEGVDKLIKDGDAKYMYIVECSPTYYIQKGFSDSSEFLISIPFTEVQNRLSIKIFVVATKDIVGCKHLEVDDVYEGIVDYPKGAVIAYLDEFSIPLKQSNDTSDLSKIIRIMPTDVTTVQNTFNSHRIIIKIPQAYGSIFDSISSSFPGLIESTFVFNALVEGFCKLREENNESIDWVFYLKLYIQECIEEDIIEEIENYEYDLDEIFKIVNRLLDNPQLAALMEAKKIIDINAD